MKIQIYTDNQNHYFIYLFVVIYIIKTLSTCKS